MQSLERSGLLGEAEFAKSLACAQALGVGQRAHGSLDAPECELELGAFVLELGESAVERVAGVLWRRRAG